MRQEARGKTATKLLTADKCELLICVVILLFCLRTLALRDGIGWTHVYGLAVAVASVVVQSSSPRLKRADEHHPALRPCDDPVGLAAGGALLATAAAVIGTSGHVALAGATWIVLVAWRGMDFVNSLCALVLYVAAVAVRKGPASTQAVAGALVAPTAHALVVNCQRTFTAAEAAVISASMNAAVATAVTRIASSFPQTKLPLVDDDLALDEAVSFGLAGCVALWWACVMPAARRGGPVRGTWVAAGIVILATYAVVWGIATHEEPVRFIARQVVMRGAAPLVACWAVGLAWIVMRVRPGKVRVERTVARKFYHAVAFVVFAAGMRVDVGVLRLGAVVGLGVLIVGEAARVGGNRAISRFVTGVACRLIDERDVGAVVVSHVYLLLGCAVPTWVWARSASTTATVLPRAAVVAVCIQDGVAAAVGKRVGTIRWGRRGRTLEGSVAGVVTAVAAITTWTALPWQVATLGALATGAVEAFTDQMDNWVMPMAFCTVLAVFL